MQSYRDIQESSMPKRVVTLIKRYLQPGEMFSAITNREWEYSVENQKEFAVRDRAMMALSFCSAGRISEVVGGPIYEWNNLEQKAHRVKAKQHLGIQVENLSFNEERILLSGMEVVKRSRKMIEKYGPQITVRDDFAIPLKCGLYDNPFWDQLVPFGWLVLEYMKKSAPQKGKLFPFASTRAYQIINFVTGNYPNWFRAQAEHFYGHFLLTDTVKLSKFVKIQDPKHVKHYIGYSWTEQLKDKSLAMDFNWIEPSKEKIKTNI